jgi:hypothetical protein
VGGGQVVLFDKDGLVCHIQDDSALYKYDASDKESVHSDPFVPPILHIADMDTIYMPNLGDYIVAQAGEEQDYLFSYEDVVVAHTISEAENCRSTPNLPLPSTYTPIRKALSSWTPPHTSPSSRPRPMNYIV